MLILQFLVAVIQTVLLVMIWMKLPDKQGQDQEMQDNDSTESDPEQFDDAAELTKPAIAENPETNPALNSSESDSDDFVSEQFTSKQAKQLELYQRFLENGTLSFERYTELTNKLFHNSDALPFSEDDTEEPEKADTQEDEPEEDMAILTGNYDHSDLNMIAKELRFLKHQLEIGEITAEEFAKQKRELLDSFADDEKEEPKKSDAQEDEPEEDMAILTGNYDHSDLNMIAKELRFLKHQLEIGEITAKEFAQKKRELLNSFSDDDEENTDSRQESSDE